MFRMDGKREVRDGLEVKRDRALQIENYSLRWAEDPNWTSQQTFEISCKSKGELIDKKHQSYMNIIRLIHKIHNFEQQKKIEVIPLYG